MAAGRLAPVISAPDGRARRVNYVEMGGGLRTRRLLRPRPLRCWQNWLENIPDFARNYRVLALDLPGSAPPMPTWEISIPATAASSDDFSRSSGVHAGPLVGNSMGGFIAAEVAIAIRNGSRSSSSSPRRDHERDAAARAKEIAGAVRRAGGAALPRQMQARAPAARAITFHGVFRHPDAPAGAAVGDLARREQSPGS